MKIMESGTYKYICQKISSFQKKGLWGAFSADETFYLVDEKGPIITSFIDNFGNEVYGMPFYYGSDGLNSFHDIMTVESEYTITLTDHCTTNIMICKRDALLDEEIAYIRSCGMNVKKEMNIVCRTFRRGYPSRIATEDEAKIILKALIYLEIMIKLEKENIIANIKNDKVIMAAFDNEKFEYNLKFGKLPVVEVPYSKKNYSKDIFDEFSSFEITTDTCYLDIKNLMIPLLRKKSEPILPLVAVYSNNVKVLKITSIVSTPKNYNQFLLGFLLEIFSKSGIPSIFYVNDRRFYYDNFKLFEALNITFQFKREHSSIDKLLFDLDGYCSKLFGLGINDGTTTKLDTETFMTVFRVTEGVVDESISVEMNYFDDDDEELEEIDESDTFIS